MCFSFSFIETLEVMEENNQCLENSPQSGILVRATLATELDMDEQLNIADQALSRQHTEDYSEGEHTGHSQLE